MDDIAAEAEVSKGTLYRYFKDKEELYLALLDRCSRDLVALLHERVAAAEGPRARLEAFVAALIAFFDAQPHLLDLIQRAEVMAVAGDEFPWKEPREVMPRLVRRLCDEAAAEGDYRVRDPEVAVWMLLGAIRAIIRFGKRPRPHDLARRMVEVFLDGAASKRGTGPAV